MKKRINRRSFLKRAGGTALTATTISAHPALARTIVEPPPSFRSAWPKNITRPWVGAEYWANPLQDWRIHKGRLECISPGGDRNVALLTREVSARRGDLSMSVRLGQIEPTQLDSGFVGFRIGIQYPYGDHRTRAIYGRGMHCGINADGRLFIGKLEPSAQKADLAHEQALSLHAQPSAGGYTLRLRAESAAGHVAECTREVPAEWLTGNLALVSSSAPVEETPADLDSVVSLVKDFSFYPPQQRRGGKLRCWFADWTVSGSKVDAHDDHAWGPILFSLYTVTNKVLKLSAQFPPLNDTSREAALQVRKGSEWATLASAPLDPDAWNATFRVPNWDASKPSAYRVVYEMPGADGQMQQHSYEGTIHADPIDRTEVKVGLLTCVWDFGFPHEDFVKHLAHHKPDVLFWTGDQIYESVGGFGSMQTRKPEFLEASMLDFQRKWLIFGWAMGDLLRNIPSVCMTDDHDMYHGNIWGCGGRPTNPASGNGDLEQDTGGYKMPPRWVNMVQRLQCAHLPDPFDPAPVLQGINVYYTDLRWGGISFAVLEDRKWKSAPLEQFPAAHIKDGFALNRAWKPAENYTPTEELLGQRQLEFLEHWAADWSAGTWMKFAVTQTLFGCIHTEPFDYNTDEHSTHIAIPPVGVYVEGDHLIADYDSGGWPQQGRNSAILKWRKAFASHLCGDQHLGTTSHYGVEQFRDGVYSVCTPAISNLFPRRWWPPQPAPNALPGTRNTGDYLDSFGNHITVFAAANPALYEGPGLDGLRHRVTGYTILTCNRATRKTQVDVWPRWVDPSKPGAKPYKGWPITIDQIDNGLYGAEWQLDSIHTQFHDPVVQVQHEATGEVLYTLRIQGTSFTPLVRQPGSYKVIAFDPDGSFYREWNPVTARKRT